jgi:hypothetical protein
MIVSDGGCHRVPKEVRWKGIRGPTPWAKGWYYSREGGGLTCCGILCNMDGLVIPGEVTDIDAPHGLQRYQGDVVLSLWAEIGGGSKSFCGCYPV